MKTSETDWTKSEPGLLEMHREVSRLKRRAISRKWSVVFLTLFLTAALVGMQLRKPRGFEASVVLSITEGALHNEKTPRPKSSLRDYIADVSFNRHVLFEVIEKYDLYSSLYSIDPNLTASLMWDDLSVEVYQNQFSEEGNDEETVRRSARVAITFIGKDPEIAIAVVNDLADRMVEFEIGKRKDAIVAASEEMEGFSDAARAIIRERSEAILAAEREYGKALDSKKREIEIRLARLRLSILKAYDRLDELNIAASNLEMMRGLESGKQGLVFDIVDRKDPATHDPRPLRITIVAVIFFFLSLPLVGVGLAAFDTRIYDLNDVARLGIPTLGHVPSFPGDDIASLSEREGPSLH